MIPPTISANLMLIALALVRYGVDSSPATGLVRSPNQPVVTTTTESPASSVLDDPTNSATTSDSSEESTNDDACVVGCFDKVTIAQEMVQCYENISRKQKNLVNRKRAAAEAAAMNAATASNKPRPNKLIRSANANTNSQNSTLNLRTLVNHQELIVVSSLRVARSTGVEGQVPKQRPPNKDKHWLNKKDAELERLQREQQRQKDITCKSLIEVRNCLDQQLQECFGNLQFHSYQVYADQYYERLRCPYPNKPNMAPFIIKTLDEEKMPIARPITSPEEVRKRLQKILPGRQFPKPLGVVRLEPTQTTQNQMRSVEQKGSYRHWSHPSYIGGDDSIAVGRILLIPAGFAILIALVAVLRYKRTWNYEEKDNSEIQQF